MAMHTSQVGAFSTRPARAIRGMDASQRGPLSMKAAIFTSPPARSTPVMLVTSKARMGMNTA